MDTIVLKVKDFLDVAGARGHTTYEQQATATGLSNGTLHRLRRGGPAGPAVIARICTTYDVTFEDVFEFATTAQPQRSRPKRARLQAAA
ncbi:helix-turn-helix domain-containing protein [Streptomyces sp. NPDC058319]|uniref:helix-turn-helix domain-containing protein n=1 Tax=unclassified Streptomyces TaxID=2593676 RepID=UPI0033BEC207